MSKTFIINELVIFHRDPDLSSALVNLIRRTPVDEGPSSYPTTTRLFETLSRCYQFLRENLYTRVLFSAFEDFSAIFFSNLSFFEHYRVLRHDFGMISKLTIKKL